MSESKDDDETKKPQKALDEKDIALLKTYVRDQQNFF